MLCMILLLETWSINIDRHQPKPKCKLAISNYILMEKGKDT